MTIISKKADKAKPRVIVGRKAYGSEPQERRMAGLPKRKVTKEED